MDKIAIVYWSGTGNTKQMADIIAKGIENAGGESQLFQPGDFSPTLADQFSVIAFGCPAMGAEVLEEYDFQPMFDAVRPHLSGKSVALFGSYGWGDGEWMRNWEKDCVSAGCKLVQAPVMANEAPDEAAAAACMSLGEALVKA